MKTLQRSWKKRTGQDVNMLKQYLNELMEMEIKREETLREYLKVENKFMEETNDRLDLLENN